MCPGRTRVALLTRWELRGAWSIMDRGRGACAGGRGPGGTVRVALPGASASPAPGREEARGALAAPSTQQAPPGRTQSGRRRRRGGEGRPRAGPNPEGRAEGPFP